MKQHLTKLVHQTVENVRNGEHLNPQFIINGIKEELRQALMFKWITEEEHAAFISLLDSND